MISWIRVLLWLLPRRLRSSWVLLTITGFGVLAAVTLMSTSALYSRALAEAGLRHTLAATSATGLNSWVIVGNRPLGPAEYQRLLGAINDLTDNRLGFMLRETQRSGHTNIPLVFTPEPGSGDLNAVLGRPFFLTDFPRHSQLLEGRWPEAPAALDGPGPDPGLQMEAVVGRQSATTMGIEVGSQAFLFPFRTDLSQRITLNVVGIAEAIDPKEEYWMGISSYFRVGDFDDKALVPFYVPEEDFSGGLGARFPTLVGDYGWFLFLDTSVLTAATVQQARDAIGGLETDINKRVPRSLVFTQLENSRGTGLLATYQRDLRLARVPLFLFIALVVVVILYFLALIMGLLARSRSDEASLFRSRGASMPQVGGLLTLAEGFTVLLAVVVGPFLALLLTRHLLLRTIDPAGAGDPLVIGLSGGVFLWGAVGGLLSFSVLLASNTNLARLGILEFLRERARPPTVALLHRYYIDLLVLAILGILCYQVHQRGGFVEQAIGLPSLEVDLTLLLCPASALLAAGFLMLRFLPFLIRLLAWTARRWAPAWANFSLARVARDPLPFGSLTVIIMMAAALGVFGAAFQSTLSKSQQEQSRYNIGGDLVLTGVSFSGVSGERRMRELAEIPGVLAVSPIMRQRATLLDVFPGRRANLVSIDPVTLPEAAWFREDFTPTDKNLSELLVPLRLGSSGLPDLGGNLASGIPIPETAESLGIWVNQEDMELGVLGQSLNFWVRLQDSRGRYRNLQLGQLESNSSQSDPSTGWDYFEAPLPTKSVSLAPPLNVVSLFVSGPTFSRMPPGRLSLDDLTVKHRAHASGVGIWINTGGQVIDGFEEPGRWVALTHKRKEADTVEVSSSAARSGESGLVFTWIDPLGGDPRGAFIPPGPFPLPAIGGPGFQRGQEVRLEVGRQIVPVVIAGTTDFFPTLEPSSPGFLLVSLEVYLDYVLRLSGGTGDFPKEFWLGLADTADHAQIADALKKQLPVTARIRDQEAAVDLARRDPLAGGGWNGLTLLSIAALTIAVVLALVTHAAVSVQSGRVDLTVVRAVGFSRLQIFLSLALERVLVAVVGLAVGSAVGYLLARWVLGLLDQTPSGRPIVPPVIFDTQPWIIALTVLCLAAAALLAICFATLSASRLKASDILRAGQ